MSFLSEQIISMYKKQLDEWPLFKNNVVDLNNIKIKKIKIGNNIVELHFNPKRMKSAIAKVDSESIKQRPCFLCDINRPKEQDNIPTLERWKILCNPYPVLKQHFTIVSCKHSPQRIKPAFSDFIELAKELENRFTIFYNGPAHGASAPDHLHFQAIPTNQLPIEKLISELKVSENNFNEVASQPYKFFYYSSSNFTEVQTAFEVLYKGLHKKEEEVEPGLNALVKYEKYKWHVIIIPRTKHRPNCFYKEEEEQILVSPASIDLAGIVVLPREEDLEKIDKETISNIFAEVIL